jgi:branched-chain amino acid transport system permease protein
MDWGLIFDQALNEALDVNAILYALAAVGLNVHFGYAGLLNFGQVGFVAMGAYGMGLTITYFAIPNAFVSVLMGILFSLIFALLLGLPTLRLRADYLAIVTIAAAEIVRLIARSTAMRGITRGAEGLNEFIGPFRDLSPFNPSALYGFGPWQWRGNRVFVIIIGWLLVVLCVLVVWQLMRSPWGRVVKAIREDEDAARALGKNAFWYKLQALMVGGVIAGFGGMVWAWGNATVQPDFLVAPLTFFFWLVLILGGVGRTWSPVIGAMIFWFLITFIQNLGRQLVDSGTLSTSIMDLSQIDQIRFWIVGLALALLMIFRPQGIFGNRDEMALDAR